MSRLDSRTLVLMLLRFAPLMLVRVFCAWRFGLLSDRFLSLANFRNILTQSTHVAVMAIGMTFVLLVRGVDLSVGSVMYLVAVVMGLYLSDVSLFVSIPAIMVIGAAFGAINAAFITGLRIAPFIVTLATLFIGRGFALYLSETKMVFQSDTVQALGRASFFGVPWAIWIAIVVAAVAWITLTQTPLWAPDLRRRSRSGLCGEGRNSRPGDYLLGLLHLQCLCGHRRANLGLRRSERRRRPSAIRKSFRSLPRPYLAAQVSLAAEAECSAASSAPCWCRRPRTASSC